jgi:iron complex outermembrane recepter protein
MSLRAMSVGAGLGAAVATPALASEPVVDFRIRAPTLRGELIQLATQAKVSLSLNKTAHCSGAGPPLSGRFTVEAALDRLLEKSGWTWRRLSPSAFEVACGKAAQSRTDVAQPSAPSASAPAVELAPLVAVATRRPAPADRLAYSVSAIDAPTLLRQGVHDLSDLAQLTPGMTVTNLGTGRDKIMLRGLSDGPLTGRAQSMVGLYLDDVRLTYNAPDPDLRLVDMESVEVLRGPQGASYGSGSLGGVIHVVTAQPDPSRLSGWIAATAGSTEAVADSHAVDAMLNAPLPGGRAALRLVVYDDLSGGYIKDSALHLDDANRSDRTGARLAFKTSLGSDWDLTAGLVDQSINSKDTQYALADAAPYTRANRLREPHDNDFNEAHLRLHGVVDGVEAKWSTAYILHSLYSRYDATNAPPVPVPPGPAAFDDHNRIATLLNEATVASTSAAKTQWLLGAFAARSFQQTASDLTVLNAPPVLALAEHRKDRLDEAAVFGEIVIPVAPSLDATLGGRVFTSDSKVSSTDVAPLAGAASTYTGGVSESGFAPKVVLAYHPSSLWLVYAQAAEGYRPGGINTLGPPGQVFGETSGLQPYRMYGGDKLWSLEAGGKLTLLSDALRLRGDFFQAFWTNIQSDLLLPSGLPFTANIGDGSDRGVEFEGAYRLGGLSLDGQFVLDNPELDRVNPGFPSRPDSGLAAVPDMSGGGSVRYVWPLPDDRSLELDGRWAYVGGSRLVLDAFTAPKMGDYWTGRLAASLLAAPWRWTLAIDNPADSRGNTFAYGNPFNVRSAPEVTPLRPRTVSLGFRRDF